MKAKRRTLNVTKNRQKPTTLPGGRSLFDDVTDSDYCEILKDAMSRGY